MSGTSMTTTTTTAPSIIILDVMVSNKNEVLPLLEAVAIVVVGVVVAVVVVLILRTVLWPIESVSETEIDRSSRLGMSILSLGFSLFSSTIDRCENDPCWKRGNHVQ
jgi:hypothetical protein